MPGSNASVGSGNWDGEIEFHQEDGSRIWDGELHLKVKPDGDVTGWGKFENIVRGGTWVIVCKGDVRGDGNLRLQIHVSDGDSSNLHSTSSTVDGDVWSTELAAPPRWHSLGGSTRLSLAP
jgi:hypothetical protein